MPSLEAVCSRLFGSRGWVPKVGLGGALSFVPVLNLFALGYLLAYARRLRRSNKFELPEWSEMNWVELFLGGLRIFFLLAIYAGIPLLLGWILSLALYFLSFGLLGVVAYLPLALCAFFSPVLFLGSLHLYLSHEALAEAFQVKFLLRIVRSTWKPLALPVVCFWGIFVLALPLYGLSFFIGQWVLVSYFFSLRGKKAY